MDLLGLMEFDLLHEKQMLDEEGLNGGEETTGTTFFLEDSVHYILIEKESLHPRVMEISSHISKQLLLEAVMVVE